MRVIGAALLVAACILRTPFETQAEPVLPPIDPDGEQLDDIEILLSGVSRWSPVTAVVFSPRGDLLASGHLDGTVRLWDLASARETARLYGHGGEIIAVAFVEGMPSLNGEAQLFFADDDGNVWSWNATSAGEPELIVQAHDNTVQSVAVAFSRDGGRLAMGDEAGRVLVRFCPLQEGNNPMIQLEERRAAVRSVVFGPHGVRLATGSQDGTVRVWDIMDLVSECEPQRQEEPVWEVVHGQGQDVLSLAFSPDGTRLVSGGTDGTLTLYDTEAERVTLTEGHAGAVQAVAFSPDGARLASGGEDGTVRLWDVAARRETIMPLEGHLGPVGSVAFGPDGALLASGGRDGTVRVWDVATGDETSLLVGHAAPVMALAFHPDGARIGTGGEDGTVRLWDTDMARPTAWLEVHRGSVRSIAFDPLGVRIASGGEDGEVRLSSLLSQGGTQTLDRHGAPVRTVAFSPDGTRLAYGAEDGAVRLWDVQAVRETAWAEWHRDGANSLAFGLLGVRLASGGGDGTVRYWSVPPRPEMVNLINRLAESLASEQQWLRDNLVNLLCAAHEYYAVLCEDTTLDVGPTEADRVGRHAAPSESPERALNGHDGSILSIVLESSGDRLVSGGADGMIRVWDLMAERERPSLGWADGPPIHSVAFSPAGERLASGGADGMVLLWDEAERAPEELGRHEGPANSVVFGPNGVRLASGGADGTVRLWDVANGREMIRLLGGRRGMWVACRSDGLCHRSDDGTLLVRTAAGGRVEPLLPPRPRQAARLDVMDQPQDLVVREGQMKSVTVTVRNDGDGPAFWVRLSGTDAGELPAGSRLVFHPPGTHQVLRSGEEITFHANLSHLGDYRHPQPGEGQLHMRVTSAHGDPLDLDPISVQTRAPLLAMSEAAEESGAERAIVTRLINPGEMAIRNAVVRAELPAQGDRPAHRFPAIQFEEDDEIAPGDVLPVSFALPEHMVLDEGATLTVLVRSLAHPSHEWVFPNVPIARTGPAWPLFAAATLAALTVLAAIYYLRVFRHPLLTRVSRDPAGLLDTELGQLPLARRLMRQTRRLGTVLAEAEVAPVWLDDAIAFRRETDPDRRAALPARRLGAERQRLAARDGLAVYRLSLPESFALNLTECLLVLPDPALPAADVAAGIAALEGGSQTVALIAATDAAQRRALAARARDPGNLLVVPDGAGLSRLLLSPEPLAALARIVADHVPARRLSPYQTRGGVSRETAFFGRGQLLAHILNREPANYLLVGGRQLGKSSLLKAVERRAAGRLDCRYLSIGDADGRRTLAHGLGLPADAPLADLVATLGDRGDGRPRLLLLDEADLFVEAEAARGAEALHAFRNLAEQGRCFFVLAGFWRLYESATLDYQSPVRNFGETLTIGALEPDACRALVTEPMAAMNLRYADDALVERIVAQTGGRANLIAITCHEILKLLDLTQRTIDADAVERALNGDAVAQALEGWQRLTGDARDNALDRAIVYATIGRDRFTAADALALAARAGDAVGAEDVRRALARLELAFVLGRDGSAYSYRVPLFRTAFADQAVYLDKELEDLRRLAQARPTRPAGG